MRLTKRYPAGLLCETYEEATAKPTLGQPELSDGGEEVVVADVGELGVQVDEEQLGTLELAPEESSFGEHRQSTTDQISG